MAILVQLQQHTIKQHTITACFKALSCGLLLSLATGCGKKPDAEKDNTQPATQSPKPALTVTTVSPDNALVAQSITASGNIAAWQEASIGAEVPGLRITSVRANVGDWVKKGELLATFESSSVVAQTAELDASIAEAQVKLTEANLNAQRFNALAGTGAVSDFQITQARATAKAAAKRLEALRASKRSQNIRKQNTRVTAPDSGLISVRNATVGAVVGTGAELFRLIRGGRLEWRGEVTANELAQLKVGLPVLVTSPSGNEVLTRIRALSPSLDARTRKALVYADLPASTQGGGFANGMFTKGKIVLGEQAAVTLPRQSIILRDGFHYVFALQPDNTVKQTKVQVGKQLDGKIQVLSSLPTNAKLILSGAGFLNDGDVVKVVSSN